MAQVNLLKIGSDGFPTESDSSSDDLTLNTFTAGTSLSVTSGVTITSDITFNAVSDTIAGIENQNLLDKTASESITGEFSFTSGVLNLPTAADGTSPVEGSVYWDPSGDTLYVYDGASYIDLTATGSADTVKKEMTADTGGVTATDAVYISSNDSVSPALGDAIGTSKVIGFAESTVAATNPVNVITAGLVSGVITGATAGDAYFLSASTAGDITATRPTGTGNVVVLVGYAANATDLCVQIQQIGKVA